MFDKLKLIVKQFAGKTCTPKRIKSVNWDKPIFLSNAKSKMKLISKFIKVKSIFSDYRESSSGMGKWSKPTAMSGCWRRATHHQSNVR
jgi:hypothetical protein